MCLFGRDLVWPGDYKLDKLALAHHRIADTHRFHSALKAMQNVYQRRYAGADKTRLRSSAQDPTQSDSVLATRYM